jgi:hypothetical protein
MKPIISIFYGIFFILCINTCFAQKTMDLENVIKQSDVIIEAKGVAVKHFRINGAIYTAITVNVLKVFKGNIADTIIEIVYEGGCMMKDTPNGAMAIEQCVTLSDGGFGVSPGSDGILLLHINNTARLDTNLQSYMMFEYIKYHHGGEMVAHHIATSRGVTYDDLEIDLFQRIEKATNQPRKTLRRNSFGL